MKVLPTDKTTGDYDGEAAVGDKIPDHSSRWKREPD